MEVMKVMESHGIAIFFCEIMESHGISMFLRKVMEKVMEGVFKNYDWLEKVGKKANHENFCASGAFIVILQLIVFANIAKFFDMVSMIHLLRGSITERGNTTFD